MNPQYLQQQNHLYGAQSQNFSYREPNANLPPNGSLNVQPSSQNNPGIGDSPLNNVQPQKNQNNIVEQMANVSLASAQKLTTSVKFFH